MSRSRTPSRPAGTDVEANRRSEILRAAVEVFATKGYHGCRIADVAKQAGVAYGLVYHYFRNKEELLESVFAQSFGRFAKSVAALVEGEGKVAAKLEQIVGFAIDAYQRDPRAVQVLILEIVHSPAFRDADKVSAMQQVLSSTSKLIAGGQRSGELRADVEPYVAASMLFGALETTLAGLVLGSPGAHSPEWVEKAKRDLLAIFLQGMAVRPPGSGRSRQGA